MYPIVFAALAIAGVSLTALALDSFAARRVRGRAVFTGATRRWLMIVGAGSLLIAVGGAIAVDWRMFRGFLPNLVLYVVVTSVIYRLAASRRAPRHDDAPRGADPAASDRVEDVTERSRG